MQEHSFFFFEKHPLALPLYEAFVQKMGEKIGNVDIRVQKTQISFYGKHMFACVSFAKVRKKEDCPDPYLVITFGLDHKVESARIDIATEPYPNRWTHHVLIGSLEEIDEELMGWIEQAYVFAERKAARRGPRPRPS